MKVIPVSQKLRLQRVFILLFDLYDVKEKTYPYYGYHSSGCDHRSSTHQQTCLWRAANQRKVFSKRIYTVCFRHQKSLFHLLEHLLHLVSFFFHYNWVPPNVRDATFSTQLAWNPGRAASKKVPVTRYYHLTENPKSRVKLTQVGTDRKGLPLSFPAHVRSTSINSQLRFL